ncbi:Thoeris anti-defense Tad2 family protein [Enterococcus faecalis]
MDIRRAVLEAKKHGKGILRESNRKEGQNLVILPTNRRSCCLIIDVSKDKKDTSNVGNNWNPTLDDLIAIDWELEE